VKGVISTEGETKLADRREEEARKAEEERLARVRGEEEREYHALEQLKK